MTKVLKAADILIQLVLVTGFYAKGPWLEVLLNGCGVALLWQLISSIIHFFIKVEWKKKTGRTIFISLLLVSSVMAVVMWATFVMAFISVLLALFCGPVLVIFYFIISIAELKEIYIMES